MYVETPRKGMKNLGLSKNRMFLLCSALQYVGKRGNSCTIRVFFLKERPYFLPSYLINFLLFSQKIFGSYPQNTVACSSYNFRNMAKYKDRCQVIISLFWTFSQLWYYLVIGGERKCQRGIVACGQMTLSLFGTQALANERDIRSTVNDTRVSEIVQHAFNQ